MVTGRIRTSEGIHPQIYSLRALAACIHHLKNLETNCGEIEPTAIRMTSIQKGIEPLLPIQLLHLPWPSVDVSRLKEREGVAPSERPLTD